MKADPGRLTPELLDAAVELMGRSGHGGTVRVQGSSMEPTLTPGQRVAVEFAPEGLRPGDLLLFRQADYLVVHRLLGTARLHDGRPAFRTRGDGVVALDPAVDRARIVGRVTALEQGAEWLSLRCRGARAYGRGLAWHDLFWAAAAVAGRRADRGLGRVGVRTPFGAWAAALDRRLLRLVHGLFFRRLHARTAAPEQGRDA